MEFLQAFPFNITLPPQRPGEDENSYWERVDYFDTMAGTPPPGFLEKHGFPISEDNDIGIIPSSEVVAKFGPHLKTDDDYQELMRTCEVFASTIDVPYFYETMYLDDIYYYLERAWKRADIEGEFYGYTRKWAIPGRNGGLVTYSLETEVPKLKRLVERAPHHFIFLVPDEEQDEDQDENSRFPPLPPNTRFMKRLKRVLGVDVAGVDDEDSDDEDDLEEDSGEAEDDADNDDTDNNNVTVDSDEDANPRARKRPRANPNASQASTSNAVSEPGTTQATTTTALEAAKRATAAAKEAMEAAKKATLASQTAEKLGREATEAAKRAAEAAALAARLAENADTAT